MSFGPIPRALRCLGAALLPAFLAGCAIPLANFAPPTRALAEKPEIPLVQLALKDGQGGQRSVRLAMGGGKPRALERPRSAAERVAGLPPADLKPELNSSHVPPFKFRQTPAGARHYYNFTVTPAFERATAAYLRGEGEAALAEIEAILADPKGQPPALLWQAAYLKVGVLVMMGRMDLAEREIGAVERYELAAMGGNHASRALRAEVRYWGGDTDGAIEDAAEVIRAFGNWRFPAAYATPPADQVELARCVTAQVRADIVLGLALLAKGQRKAALPWLELASQTMNNVLYVSRHPLFGLYFQPPEEVFWGRGMSLLALGTALLADDPASARAETLFAQAAEFFDALGFASGGVMIQAFKAQALAWAGRAEGAARQAAAGLAQAERLGLMDYVWRLEALRGQQLLVLGRTDEAEGALRRAQAVVDLMAGTLDVDDAKVRFGIGKEAITHQLVRLDLQKRDLARLFEDMERGRARAFVAMLANRVVAQGRGGAEVEGIRNLDREIRRERQRKNALAAGAAAEAGREQQLLEERAGRVARLRLHDPDLADALAVSAVGLATVQKSLPRDAALVYALPVEDTDSIAFLMVTAQGAEMKTLALRPPQLKALLDAFVATLEAGDGGRQKAALDRIGAALGLAEWPRVAAIHFVPSGHTHFIPWGGLNTPFAVATLPTGGWVARASAGLPAGARAAVVGDPAFGGILPQLPGARQEAQLLGGLYGAAPLIGEGATEPALRGAVGGGVDVLHFATHALFDPHYPLQSSLILTDGRHAVPLTAERLFAAPLPARLVVLSACETGMGLLASGEELLGLPRSFYLGGASSVISSLWPVDDEATKLYMETFHRHSRGGGYGPAWLAARDAVRERGFPPSAYGAFILGGSLGLRE